MIIFITILFSINDVGLYSFNDENSWKISVDINTQKFVDKYGRIRIFHGTNVVLKNPHPFTTLDFNRNDIKIIRELGYNIIRLGVLWSGIMPSNRSINYYYLNELKRITEMAKEFGVYVLLDMHQDLFSEAFCGDGAPIWIFSNENYFHNFPFPLKMRPYSRSANGTIIGKQCYKLSWQEYYASYAVLESFEILLTNKPPLRLLDLFVDVWVAVAEFFRHQNNVIGYDLINEPLSGNFYKNPSLLDPHIANKRLMKFYKVLFDAIRKVEDEKLLFLEPVTWTFSSTGFKNIPGDRVFANRTVINFHYYKPPNFSIKKLIQGLNDEVETKLKCGLILSEFMLANDNTEANLTMDLADQYKLSYLGWEYYSIRYPDNEINHTWTRIYPVSVAGNLKFYKFNRQNQSFILEYQVVNHVIKNQTVISYSTKYFNKPNVTIISVCNLKWEYTDIEIIFVHYGCKFGELISINLQF